MNTQRNELFRRYLSDELLKRSKSNARYSLRAFSKSLDIQTAALSQILKGERTLTDKMCRRLASRLSLAPNLVVELMQIPTPPVAKGEYRNLDVDLFNAIAEWYHFAILELTHIKGFKANDKWVAKALGIGSHEVRVAVERMIRLGFLEIDANGHWHDRLGDALNQGNEITNAALRKYQKQILEKAIAALDDTPYEARVQSSMVLPVSLEKLPTAKKKITEFIRSLSEELRSGKSQDEVYQFGISLYPVTNLKQINKDKL